MRFICLGYADENAWDAMSPKEQSDAMETCLAFDKELGKGGGQWISAGEALQSVRAAKTLRWHNGKVIVTDGPFAETKEQLGGFFVFGARNMDHAVELLSKHPGLRFGPMEIRPADEQINALVAERMQPIERRAGGKMMRFICLGYADENACNDLTPSEQAATFEEGLAHDNALRRNGHSVNPGEALQSARTAKTLRWRGGKVMVTDGPFAETKEQLGGFGVVEAKDIDHAVELVRTHPCLRHGVFEIRPADEQINALVAERLRPDDNPGR